MFRLISSRMRLTIIFRFERVSCGRIRQQKSDPIVSLISASNSCHVPSNNFFSILCPTGHGLRYFHIPWISCLPQSIQYLFLSRLFIACSSSLQFLMIILPFNHPATYRAETHRSVNMAMIDIWTSISLRHYLLILSIQQIY